MSSKPVFYYMLESPACRTVIATARLVGVELELKRLNLFNKEQLTPEFVQINPFHCIPTLVDTDGFVVWESRAIAAYLVQSRQPNSPLYPSDLKKRVTVDKFLHYDLGGLYRALSDVAYAGMQGVDPAPKVERLKEVLKTLEEFLAQNGAGFIAGGSDLTLADIAIHFDLCYLDMMPQISLNDYPNIKALNDRIEAALKPINQDGLFNQAKESVKKMMEEMKKKAAEAKN